MGDLKVVNNKAAAGLRQDVARKAQKVWRPKKKKKKKSFTKLKNFQGRLKKNDFNAPLPPKQLELQ